MLLICRRIAAESKFAPVGGWKSHQRHFQRSDGCRYCTTTLAQSRGWPMNTCTMAPALRPPKIPGQSCPCASSSSPWFESPRIDVSWFHASDSNSTSSHTRLVPSPSAVLLCLCRICPLRTVRPFSSLSILPLVGELEKAFGAIAVGNVKALPMRLVCGYCKAGRLADLG